MNRTTITTLATIAGTILGAITVLAVQAVRRHRTSGLPTRGLVEESRVCIGSRLPVIPVAVVPPVAGAIAPAANGDRAPSPTPLLDEILAQRALEQRDDLD